MILKDFLVNAGTEKNLMELVLFLAQQAQQVKKGFFCSIKKTPADKQTRNMYGEEQMPLDMYADDVLLNPATEKLVKSLFKKKPEEDPNDENKKESTMIESYLNFLREGGEWIQKAIKSPGTLHKALNVPKDETIPAKKLAVKSSDSSKMKKRKILAQTLRKISKKKKLGEGLTESEKTILSIIKSKLESIIG